MMKPVILGDVPDGRIVVLQDGTIATTSHEYNGVRTLIEASMQDDHSEELPETFYFHDEATVFIPE